MIGWLAAGAGALCVLATAPVAVHLLSHHFRRDRFFPTARFLGEHRAGRSRLSRLRQFLVLALRTLALLALAIAVCGPVLRSSTSDGWSPAVIVLDASCSMRQRDGATTCWEEAKGAVERLSRELSSRPIQVVLAGDHPHASGNLPELDRGGVRALLASAEAGYGTGSVPQAVASALGTLGARSDGAEAGGDLYLVTDGAATCMAGVDPQALPGAVHWHTVVVGGGGDNVAVAALGLEPGVALVGRPCTVTARIVNHSDQPRTATVEVALGGTTRLLDLALLPEATATAAVTMTPQSSGQLDAHARIVSCGGVNALAEDDERFGVVTVDAALPVHVFSDENPSDQGAALKPLLAALVSAGLTPTLAPGAALSQLTDGDRAIIVTVGILAPPRTEALQRHLLSGGCLLQVISSDGDAALCHGLGELVAPAQPGAAIDLSARAHGLSLMARALDHPLVISLRGREPLLSQIEAYRHRPAPPADGSLVALAWEDGSVALGERAVGRGRWLLLNIDPTSASSDLATLEVLPLLLGRLPLIGMPPSISDCASACGASHASSQAVIDPSGSRVALIDGGCVLSRPGLYRALDGVTSVVGAGIPESEGDLRHAVLPAGAQAVTSQQAWVGARDQPLWPWFLLAGLLLLIGELALASRRVGQA
jgi:hypothetical protein